MKIKSPFNDFYDCMTQYGTEDYIYFRKTEKLNEENKIYFKTSNRICAYYKTPDYSIDRASLYLMIAQYINDILSFDDRSIDINFMNQNILTKIYNELNTLRTLSSNIDIYKDDININCFIIAGKLFYIFNINKFITNDFNEFLNYILDNNLKKINQKHLKKMKKYLINVTNDISSTDFSLINNDLNSPIIQIEFNKVSMKNEYQYDYKSSHVVTNIIKDPQLVPYIKFLPDQNYMWAELNNWFANKNNENYEESFKNLTDIDRLEKHGFDKKTSFRKTK